MPIASSSSRLRRLSCGIVVLTEAYELLLCHVTGQRHWDLPKGGIHADESPLEAALRETREETGLRLAATSLLDLGQHSYTTKKDLHLFAVLSARIDTGALVCESCFIERHSGQPRPEMDGFGWFPFDRVAELCTPRLATLLGERIDLASVVAMLAPAQKEPLAA